MTLQSFAIGFILAAAGLQIGGQFIRPFLPRRMWFKGVAEGLLGLMVVFLLLRYAGGF